MALTERLALLISLDANGAVRGLENVGKAADRNLGRAESKIDRTAQRMQKAGVGMLAASGIAATGLYKAGQAAADLEQAVGGTEAVFKETSGVIDRFAKNAAKDMGLSERAFRESTTGIGGQLKGLGFDIDDAAEKSIDLTRTAADLAATYGGTTADAVGALGAALRGEADPAERFNLFLNQTRVNAKAVELGLAETTSQVDANAKAQATLALITEQSADALGQFGRETGTASGQMQIASAEFENAKAQLGESVAPILADVAGGLADVAGGFSRLNESTGGAASKLATFGTIGLGALGGLSFVTGKMIELRNTFQKLPASTGRAAAGIAKVGAALGAAFVAAELFSSGRSGRISDEIEDQFDIDTEKLSSVRRGLEEMNAELAELAENEGKGRLFSFGPLDYNQFLTNGDADRQERLDQLREQVGILEDTEGALSAQADAERDATEATSGLIGPTSKLSDETSDVAKEAEAAGQAYSQLADELQGLFDPLFGALDAMEGVQDAQEAVADAVESVSDAQRDYNEAVKENGRDSEEARDAAERLSDAQRDLERAERGTITAALDQETALINLRAEVENGNVSLRDARGKLDEWVASGAISEEQARTLTGQLEFVAAAAAAIPEQVTIDINVNRVGYEAAIAELTRVATGGNTRVSVGGGGGLTLAAGGIVPDAKYFATGGQAVGTDTVPAMLTPGEFAIRRPVIESDDETDEEDATPAPDRELVTA